MESEVSAGQGARGTNRRAEGFNSIIGRIDHGGDLGKRITQFISAGSRRNAQRELVLMR